MGLDMYLSAKNYIAYDDENKELVKAINDVFPEAKGNITTVIANSAAYWRKANAIHNWFVKNIQNGVDNCDSYDLERSDLQRLIDLCKEVLSNKEKALELLPPSVGFFFGSNETDDWYWESLQDTITQLEDCLSWDENWSFTYHSSW